jgi:hypothetical protein
MSASRARSSLRAMLRLAKEGSRANNGPRLKLLIPDGILLALLNQPGIINRAPLRRPFRPTPQDRATPCVPRRSRADIPSLCHPAHSPSANTKSPLPTATKDLLSDLFCGSRQNFHSGTITRALAATASTAITTWLASGFNNRNNQERANRFIRARLLFLARLVCHQL